uniref:TRAP transporter solute receptor, TAXI family n=1 Tax=Candidatus Kentrum sp. FM TaxID=2126340 RepID=A0A450VVZ8_9GAMM|nr:MAG: hypothetical protein BECKFM1743C_GA0114222_100116 [Candidatus Kentron sp. FM]VFJ61351.1 MAG: hypothetical protein BECKFM1743A_GA0114220_102823 [Candidatus Kentron sp. FM]VFK08957.1 MAG: hypothetical protein BECKFM1743B_GA0114221_100886 [Candidatus Kentron sp. FM]
MKKSVHLSVNSSARLLSRLLSGLALVGALAFPSWSYAQEILKAHGPAADGGSYAATIGVAKLLEKYTDFRMQIQSGQTGTKSMVQLARARIDFTLIPVNAVNLMREQKAMYRKLKGAPALAEKLRGLMVWECCSWHYLTYADSGIESFSDLEGKKVYTGPPGSVAKHFLQTIIGTAGLEAGRDYTPVNLDWGSGGQAFRDRNLDVLIQPAFIGSPVIEQFAVSRKIRVIDLPEESEAPGLKEALSLPGREIGVIAPGTYKGAVNEEPVRVISMRHIGGVGLHLDPDVVYAMTAAVWDHIDEFHAYGARLHTVNREQVFKSMNIPLHAGAYRYYKEKGFDIPAHIIPPEAE